MCVFWNCCAGVNVSIRGRNWYSNMLRLSGGRGRALHKLSARQKEKNGLFYVLDLRKKLKSRFVFVNTHMVQVVLMCICHIKFNTR